MKPDAKKRLAYIAVIYISAVYASLAIRSILLGKNDSMAIFYTLLIIMAAAVIMAVFKNSTGIADITIFALLVSGGFYTSVRCSVNRFYLVALSVTIILLFLFIRYKVKGMDYVASPAGIFRIKVFILKILHFQFVFSLLFIGMESVTVFSTGLAVVTLFFIAIIRYYVFDGQYGIIVVGTLLEAAALIFAVIIMPKYGTEDIVAFQMENAMQSYINGFLCALLLSLLEIPFNPIWSFEKNLKG